MKFLRNNSCQGKGGLDWEKIVLDENKLDRCSNRKQKSHQCEIAVKFGPCLCNAPSPVLCFL